jgi:hypothetical protein
VIGMASAEAAWMTALARSGKTQEEWLELLKPAMEQAVAGRPRLQDLATRQEQLDKFGYGLDRLLDGLERR